MRNNTYPGDVLESALNVGLKATMERYRVDKQYVQGLYNTFVREQGYETRCACEIKPEMMCFICIGPSNPGPPLRP